MSSRGNGQQCAFLIVLFCSCVSLLGQGIPIPPKGAPPSLAAFVGDYSDARDTVMLYENDEHLYWHDREGADIQLEILADNRFTFGRDTLAAESNGNQLRFRGNVYCRLSTTTGTFHIALRRPIDQLRIEAARAIPPPQSPDLQPPELIELRSLDSTIQYDIRYASKNNFMSAVFYSQAKAFMQQPAAEALVKAHRWLQQRGYGILIHDAYRPWYVTKMFWDATPVAQRDFVANPAKGSKHNRGCAVDLSLYDLATNRAVEMPCGYDEFSRRAHPEYPGGTARQRWYRQLLRTAMEREGFQVERVEWWHFDYGDWRQYPVMNVPFEEITIQ
jgi:D-alanyl-D-alanine dipeptidase